MRVAFKVGCKVMLCNLSDILVNGLLGIVTKLEDEYIHVHFNALLSSYPSPDSLCPHIFLAIFITMCLLKQIIFFHLTLSALTYFVPSVCGS